MWFGREALAFYQAGFNLLLPDARGHGKSQGTYVGMGWHDRLDIKEWICWLVRQYPDSEIVLYGVSMGAAAVMMAAGEKLPSNVKAAVEDCGYTSAWSVLSYQMKSQFHLPAFPFLYCADFVTRIRAGYGMKEADALKCVAGTRLPMFFIHGTEDQFPCSHARHSQRYQYGGIGRQKALRYMAVKTGDTGHVLIAQIILA